MNMDRRQRFLLVVLLVLLPFGAWKVLKPWFGGIAGGGFAGLGRSTGGTASPWLDTEVVDLQLGSLEVAVHNYQPGRNIFRYPPKVVYRPPPPPPLPPPPPPPVVPVEVKPRPPEIDFSLLGVFGPEKRRIAVFTDEQDAILNVQENEVFKEHFILQKIDLKWVYVGFVDFPDEPPVQLEIGS
ncbi:MAG: hypothetical protein HC897_12310 [Thermoanaerobaculia bacterium]|nr:hypothetical protein [Thermoanaerobaculia bacterium]